MIIIVVLGLFGYAGGFIYRNLRGVRPALGPVAQTTPIPSEAINTTGLPLTLPSGFSISVFARNFGSPRVLAWDPSGVLLTSIPSQGKVVALIDANNDGSSDETITVMEGLSLPHGLAFRDGKLYIAETNQVAIYDYNVDTKKATNKKKLFDLPGGGNHFSRTIGFGPDGKLYISVGSSCNVCYEKDERRARILVANSDGSDMKPFANGLRNSVFFTWHPSTQEMWATEMGRDLLGDDLPPDEVNIIRSKGTRHYGWPSCYGKQIADRDYIKSYNKNHISPEGFCLSLTEPSFLDLPAHSAPLGLAFIPDSWPKDLRGDLLVSYHGSWNRSEPTGYKIVRFDLNNNFAPADFVTGWLTGGSALGRPVDLLFDPQGNLYISDDKAGVVYKIVSSD